MDVVVLIDEFDDALNNAKSGLLSSQVRVDREEAFSILDRMRTAIPEEIKQARWIAKEAEEMLAEARRESERILDEGQEERDRLICPEEIAKLAERRAERILQDARTRERQIRLGAEYYADDILGSLETSLQRLSEAVRRGRGRLPSSEMTDRPERHALARSP